MGKRHGANAGKGINLIKHHEDDTREVFEVDSDTDKRKRYLVTRNTEDESWACTCKSWVFQNGTDAKGYCKHIRFAVSFK